MMKRPAIMFYTGDWMKDPHLAMCSPATRGIWIDMLCLMHENSESGKLTGFLPGLSRACRCTPDELSDALFELNESGASDISPALRVTDHTIRITIISRRMVRAFKARKSNADRQKRHRDREQDDNVTDGSLSNTDPSSVAVAVSPSVSPSKKKKKRSSGDDLADIHFDEFWEHTYHKKSKGVAKKTFAKVCDSVPVVKIMNAWKQQNKTWREETADKQYVPYPASWLNAEGWDDDLLPANAKPQAGQLSPDDDLTGKHVELIGGPGKGAHGPVRKHEGGWVMFYDEIKEVHNVRQDEVRVVTNAN